MSVLSAVPPQSDAIRTFLATFLDRRIVARAVAALEAEEAFTVDDLLLLRDKSPEAFGRCLSVVTAEKVGRALDAHVLAREVGGEGGESDSSEWEEIVYDGS